MKGSVFVVVVVVVVPSHRVQLLVVRPLRLEPEVFTCGPKLRCSGLDELAETLVPALSPLLCHRGRSTPCATCLRAALVRVGRSVVVVFKRLGHY